jgi:type I restriction enzyme S subunit
MDYSKYQIVRPGQFVMNHMDLLTGFVDLSKYVGVTSPDYRVFESKGNTFDGFYLYIFQMCYWGRVFYGLGQGVSTMGRWRLPSDEFLNFLIPFPPLPEQEEIVRYLDTKTQEIDQLVSITQKKIDLLKERRTSTINEVVTKGLNPNVELKDSGVEWIGEIPSHWEVKKLKYGSDIRPSNVDKHVYEEEIPVKLCNYTNVYYNEKITNDLDFMSGSCGDSEYFRFLLNPGDVVITKDSETPDDIGIPTLVQDEIENLVCGYHLTMIRPMKFMGGYVFRFIQSDLTRKYFEVNSNGVTRYGLGKPTIENLQLPFPPLPEQEEIVRYLDTKTQEIDQLVSIEEKRIETLKEYRQSVISEVVTGKVKVTSTEPIHEEG